MIKEKIQSSIKDALKNKDKIRLDTTRLLLSAIQYEEMQKKVEPLPDDASISVLQREVNRRKEEIEFAEKGNRSDLKEKLLLEITCIETFLPTQLSANDLEKFIVDLKSKDPATNLGAAMKALKDSFAGQYDGKLASEIARKILA
jgi:uncharacterized protein